MISKTCIRLFTILGLSAVLMQTLHAQESQPKVLIIGDSISMGYGPIVAGMLANEADVTRPLNEKGGQLNCEGTTRGIEKIDEWLAAADWDVIHFNFGLHDMKRVHPDTGRNSSNPEHPQQASLSQYETNLKTIVDKLKKSGAILIFATTTPFPDKPSGPLRRSSEVEKYNDVAVAIMNQHSIRVNDLHGFVEPRMDQLLLPNNVHFKAVGSRTLARRVTDAIRTALPEKKSDKSEFAQAWEHMAVHSEVTKKNRHTRSSQRIFNSLGADGWQLVDVVTIDREGTTEKLIYYFKRPK